jgi:hypothetical protein
MAAMGRAVDANARTIGRGSLWLPVGEIAMNASNVLPVKSGSGEISEGVSPPRRKFDQTARNRAKQIYAVSP